MWIQDSLSYLVGGVPLWVILLCGVVGILIDIDHPISYYLTGWDDRFLHTPLLVISCLVLSGSGAYLGGLLIGMVLGK